MKVLALAILLACFASGAAITRAEDAGKITADPNVGHSCDSACLAGETDRRLATKVTYEARRQPLRVIVSDLTAKTGVLLKAGWNGKDWQVRDRRMSIFAKDATLAQLMNAIAHVMMFKWEVSNKDKEPAYRLYADRASMREAETQFYDQEERALQKRKKLRSGALDRIAQAAGLTEDELAGIKDSSPYLYALASSGAARSTVDFLTAYPRARDSFLEGEALEIPLSLLPDEARNAAVQAIRDQWKITAYHFRGARMGGGIGYEILPDDQMDAILSKTLVAVSAGSGRSLNQTDLGSIGFWVPGQQINGSLSRIRVHLPVMDSDSLIANSQGALWNECAADSGSTYEQAKSRVVSKRGVLTIEQVQKETDAAFIDAREAVAEHEDAPQLEVKLKPSAGSRMMANYDDLQAAVAEATGMLVVADAFGSPAKLHDSLDGMTARQALDNIQDKICVNWWRKEATIELRDRNWLRRRARQLPDETLDRWRKSVKVPGSIGLDELAEMSLLSAEQVDSNITGDPVLGARGIVNAVGCYKTVLAFYARLDSSGKRQLFEERGGLSLARLSPEMRALAGKFVYDPRLLDSSDAMGQGCRLTATKYERNGMPAYSFRLNTPASDMQCTEWNITFL